MLRRTFLSGLGALVTLACGAPTLIQTSPNQRTKGTEPPPVDPHQKLREDLESLIHSLAMFKPEEIAAKQQLIDNFNPNTNYEPRAKSLLTRIAGNAAFTKYLRDRTLEEDLLFSLRDKRYKFTARLDGIINFEYSNPNWRVLYDENNKYKDPLKLARQDTQELMITLKNGKTRIYSEDLPQDKWNDKSSFPEPTHRKARVFAKSPVTRNMLFYVASHLLEQSGFVEIVEEWERRPWKTPVVKTGTGIPINQQGEFIYFGEAYCHPCHSVGTYLMKHKVPFREVDIRDDRIKRKEIVMPYVRYGKPPRNCYDGVDEIIGVINELHNMK